MEVSPKHGAPSQTSIQYDPYSKDFKTGAPSFGIHHIKSRNTIRTHKEPKPIGALRRTSHGPYKIPLLRSSVPWLISGAFTEDELKQQAPSTSGSAKPPEASRPAVPGRTGIPRPLLIPRVSLGAPRRIIACLGPFWGPLFREPVRVRSWGFYFQDAPGGRGIFKYRAYPRGAYPDY